MKFRRDKSRLCSPPYFPFHARGLLPRNSQLSRGPRFTLSSMRRIHLSFSFFFSPPFLPPRLLAFHRLAINLQLRNRSWRRGTVGWHTSYDLNKILSVAVVDRRKMAERGGKGEEGRLITVFHHFLRYIPSRQLIKKPLRLHLGIIFKRFSASASA